MAPPGAPPRAGKSVASERGAAVEKKEEEEEPGAAVEG